MLKNLSKYLVLIVTLMMILVGCSNANTTESTSEASSKKLSVVTTNSILSDMVKEVAGDAATIHSIVPVGTDPHEYEPLPEDIKKVTNADIVFYNGLNLETGGNGWFSELMTTAKKEENKDFFATSKGVTPLYLTSKGQEDQQDPHAWLDISNGIKYVENIKEVLSQKDPNNKALFEKNAAAYIEKLKALDDKAKKEFADIPSEKKLLVTSEGAFKYFSKAYGLEAGFIWEINTEEQGTPEQMTTIIKKIKATKVPSLFVETSVDPRSMERVSKETGLPIYATIFTDSIAKPGEEGDSYYEMIEYNLTKIHEGLTK